jgi:EAL domain-containing protein (putative c-di-GMP-specific phosphodiesterase class I)
MDDFEHVLDTIKVQRNDDIKISMDDFGTGYSSLSLLRRLPIDELKIDKSFVDNTLDDRKAASTIKSIIAIADSHELDLIAEGVEEEAQAAKLNEMGCNRYQGYHFYRPQNIQEIIDDVS